MNQLWPDTNPIAKHCRPWKRMCNFKNKLSWLSSLILQVLFHHFYLPVVVRITYTPSYVHESHMSKPLIKSQRVNDVHHHLGLQKWHDTQQVVSPSHGHYLALGSLFCCYRDIHDIIPSQGSTKLALLLPLAWVQQSSPNSFTVSPKLSLFRRICLTGDSHCPWWLWGWLWNRTV